ncbi:RNA polymerase sigma factor [Mucilaginibacter psychrotolerans]|uniref:Sigma-70 family RNA polymerase sigma factor n=1 Tax=Mucilaginibacter psychrotolerans TaxID=1524096 RepID=A0A4Y8S771_9SPHI|nr:sigma-70 family RNA polymerase sigma factor [Mucilaginibacter psychrotolerans]TFF34772.1 sigma-70 family RNA polymerase sigma factor [Mucilaginibacter psychrotolerans]
MMPVNNTNAETEKLMMRLYKSAFPAVARYVAKLGGNVDDARDVFQDALVIYYEKAAIGKLELQKGESAYLLGIAKHLWHKKFRNGRYDISLDEFEGFDLPDEIEPQPIAEKLQHYLETAGQRCMQLLGAFYYDKLPMKQIAGLFGYAGERSVTVQKYKCLEKVRETIKQNALQYEDFID